MTGFASEEPSLGGKWLGLLKEVAPPVRHCAVLFHPESAPAVPQFLASIEEIGRTLSVATAAAPVRDEREIDAAIAAAARAPNGGLIFLPDAFTLAKRSFVVARVAAHAVPAVFYHRAYTQAGGLLSYGINRPQQFRQAARYVQLILTGTNPVDLPVQQPTEFELAINLRTAKSLGLEISPAFLARADEVIE
jgi:putative ABC transport system substrate-binding protein